MSTTIEVNQEELSALNISELTGLSKHIKENSKYYSSKEAQKEYGYVLVVLQEEIDKRVNNIFTF